MPDNSQHVSAKGKSSLAKIIAFYNEKTRLWKREEQWMLFIFTLARFLALSPIKASPTDFGYMN